MGDSYKGKINLHCNMYMYIYSWLTSFYKFNGVNPTFLHQVIYAVSSCMLNGS